MKIIPLSEGTFTIDKTKQFIPFDTGLRPVTAKICWQLTGGNSAFYYYYLQDILLLDTGLGFLNNQGVLQIHQNLVNNNINPSDITKVLLSHLHKDHAGGISQPVRGSSKRIISFPNATYYVNKKELEHALATGGPSYLPDEFRLLSESSNVQYTEGNGIIDNYIQYEVTGAHSLFHQAFWIDDEGRKIFFGADDAPQLQQMKSRFVAKYDYDGKKSMELRKLWWQKGQEEKWTFLFYHDIKFPVFEF